MTDQNLCNVFRNARFYDTAEKVLQSASNTDRATFDDLFMALYPQIKYLQDEHATLIVLGSFNSTISWFFRCLQLHLSFTPEALEDARSADSVTSAYRPRQGAMVMVEDSIHFHSRTPGSLTPDTRCFGRRVHSTAHSTDGMADQQQTVTEQLDVLLGGDIVLSLCHWIW